MNSYLLENEDYISIEQEVQEIIKKEDFTTAEISIYDLDETELSNALEDLDTYNFLSSKKIIIIRNIENLKYDENKKDFDHLFKYIDNPSKDKLLIIETHKLKNNTKSAKELKKRCKYSSAKIDVNTYVRRKLEGFKYSDSVIRLLNEYCNGDITKISNECDKLTSYKSEDKTIEIKDIKELVNKKLGDSQELTFSFTRNIGEKNKSEALKEYKQLLEYNIEPLGIIGLLASQLRIIYQVKILSMKHLNNQEIATMINEKEYRVKKTRELISLYTEQELLRLMQKLSDIDLKIKTTDTDPNTEIELFIIAL